MKTCRNCGTVFHTRDCKKCALVSSAKWKAANSEKRKVSWARYFSENREKVKANIAKWRAENREKENARTSKWRADNPEKVKAKYLRWCKANPEMVRLYDHNYRARKRAIGGKLSVGLTAKLFELQKGKCPCCNKPLGDGYHLDHRMPLALGGANEDWNMQLLRASCNSQKWAKHPVDFMQSRGFLL